MKDDIYNSFPRESIAAQVLDESFPGKDIQSAATMPGNTVPGIHPNRARLYAQFYDNVAHGVHTSTLQERFKGQGLDIFITSLHEGKGTWRWDARMEALERFENEYLASAELDESFRALEDHESALLQTVSETNMYLTKKLELLDEKNPSHKYSQSLDKAKGLLERSAKTLFYPVEEEVGPTRYTNLQDEGYSASNVLDDGQAEDFGNFVEDLLAGTSLTKLKSTYAHTFVRNFVNEISDSWSWRARSTLLYNFVDQHIQPNHIRSKNKGITTRAEENLLNKVDRSINKAVDKLRPYDREDKPDQVVDNNPAKFSKYASVLTILDVVKERYFGLQRAEHNFFARRMRVNNTSRSTLGSRVPGPTDVNIADALLFDEPFEIDEVPQPTNGVKIPVGQVVISLESGYSGDISGDRDFGEGWKPLTSDPGRPKPIWTNGECTLNLVGKPLGKITRDNFKQLDEELRTGILSNPGEIVVPEDISSPLPVSVPEIPLDQVVVVPLSAKRNKIQEEQVEPFGLGTQVVKTSAPIGHYLPSAVIQQARKDLESDPGVNPRLDLYLTRPGQVLPAQVDSPKSNSSKKRGFWKGFFGKLRKH